MKDKVYGYKSKTVQELMNNIQEEISGLGPDILQNIMQNVAKRKGVYKVENGGHLKETIFRT